MKRMFLIVMLSLMIFTLNGCSENLNRDESDLSGFDSFICFAASNVTDSELDEIAHIIESRAKSNDTTPEYKIMIEYDTNTIRLNFNYIEEWAEHFIETAADRNSLEFRKGDSIDGELVLTNKNIKSAYAIYDNFNRDYGVVIEFDEYGLDLFSNATEELAGTDTTISIWLDDELLSAPRIRDKITTETVVISGNLDRQSAADIAEKINSVPLYYDLIISEYKFGA